MNYNVFKQDYNIFDIFLKNYNPIKKHCNMREMNSKYIRKIFMDFARLSNRNWYGSLF